MLNETTLISVDILLMCHPKTFKIRAAYGEYVSRIDVSIICIGTEGYCILLL